MQDFNVQSLCRQARGTKPNRSCRSGTEPGHTLGQEAAERSEHAPECEEQSTVPIRRDYDLHPISLERNMPCMPILASHHETMAKCMCAQSSLYNETMDQFPLQSQPLRMTEIGPT